MINGSLIEDSTSNVLRYKLYLSREPTDQLVESYRQFIGQKVISSEFLFDLRMGPEHNLLHGKNQFNQNIEDEWLCIYLLFELSKHDQDTVIQVRDSDGEILLIEAADHLPAWLETKKSRNRTYIHRGLLHIIPENISLDKLMLDYPNSSSASEAAASFIRDVNKNSSGDTESDSPVTKANSAIQEAIMAQLSGMPDKNAWMAKRLQQLDEIIGFDWLPPKTL